MYIIYIIQSHGKADVYYLLNDAITNGQSNNQ